jgi:hypothetical protein
LLYEDAENIQEAKSEARQELECRRREVAVDSWQGLARNGGVYEPYAFENHPGIIHLPGSFAFLRLSCPPVTTSVEVILYSPV